MTRTISLTSELESGGIKVAMAVGSADESKLIEEAARRLKSAAGQKAKGYSESGESTVRTGDSFVRISYPDKWASDDALSLVGTLEQIRDVLTGNHEKQAGNSESKTRSHGQANEDKRSSVANAVSRTPVDIRIDHSQWLEALPDSNPGLLHILKGSGIASEEEYRDREGSLRDEHRVALAKFRFLHAISVSGNSAAPGGRDLRLLAAFSPVWLKDIPLAHHDFPTRARNILARENITKFSQLETRAPGDLLSLDSFGQNTYKDLYLFLERNLIECASSILAARREKTELENTPDVGMGNFQSLWSSILALVDDERSRKILEARVGVDQEAKTLDAIGQGFGVCRERVRQMQAKAVSKLHEKRKFMKIKEDVERELNWQVQALRGPIPLGSDCPISFFKDIAPASLKRFLQMILGTEYRVLLDQGDVASESGKIVRGLSGEALRQARQDLKEVMTENVQEKRSIFMPLVYGYIESRFDASIHSDLKTYVDEWVNWDYSGDPRIISFGDSIHAAVTAVLERAGEPLSFNEIIKRARDEFGCDQNDGSIRNAVNELCAVPGSRWRDDVAISLFQYGRSAFCTKRALPINLDDLSYLVPGLVRIIYDGRKSVIQDEPYQWHTSDLLQELNAAIPENELSELESGVAWRAVDWLLRYHDPEGIVNLTKGFWVREVPGVRQTKRTQQEAVEYLLRHHSDAKRLRRSELANEFPRIQSPGAGYPFQGLNPPIVERDGEFFLDE